jgi:hypothetical protein
MIQPDICGGVRVVRTYNERIWLGARFISEISNPCRFEVYVGYWHVQPEPTRIIDTITDIWDDIDREAVKGLAVEIADAVVALRDRYPERNLSFTSTCSLLPDELRHFQPKT